MSGVTEKEIGYPEDQRPGRIVGRGLDSDVNGPNERPVAR